MTDSSYPPKEEWGPGPWQDEPDREDWTEPNGCLCSVQRLSGAGHLNGYVSLPDGSPLDGRGYGDYPLGGVRVHGGLTFAGATDQPGWLVGLRHRPRRRPCPRDGRLRARGGLGQRGLNARAVQGPGLAAYIRHMVRNHIDQCQREGTK